MDTTKKSESAAGPVLVTRGRTIRFATRYDRLVRLITLGHDKRLRQMTVDMAYIKPGDIVLEVGCGTGEVTIAAKTATGPRGQVYGIDAASEMIAVARSKVVELGIEIEFQVDLIEALSFPDNYFDVVVSSLMMHHLPNDLKLKGLSEIYRVLKPGGHLLVIDAKRPTTFQSRLLTAFLHPDIKTGTHELPTMMTGIGFTHIEAGNAPFPMLAFVRGVR